MSCGGYSQTEAIFDIAYFTIFTEACCSYFVTYKFGFLFSFGFANLPYGLLHVVLSFVQWQLSKAKCMIHLSVLQPTCKQVQSVLCCFLGWSLERLKKII